jgi:hypothetical protein
MNRETKKEIMTIEVQKIGRLLFYCLLALIVFDIALKYLFNHFINFNSYSNTSDLINVTRVKYSLPLVFTILIILLILLVNRRKKYGLSFWYLVFISLCFLLVNYLFVNIFL